MSTIGRATPTSSTNSSRLFRIEEFSELWVDTCLRNSEGEFKFLSLYGRDGAVMQFMAAMELGQKDGGIQCFHLVDGAGERHPVYAGTTARLSKHAGRLPRQNLFGPLSQMWIYDKNLQQIDRVNRIGWVVYRLADGRGVQGPSGSDLGARSWPLIQRLSPIALLDHWREPLVDWCLEKRAVEPLGDERYPAIGDVQAIRVSIGDHFVKHVSACVRDGLLRL
ncbi:hypothetical protein NU688_33115 [Variovorax sp. ZS18.2.2]|uniref:hypothetical protein n=1 Tax=Variovorax sp. ZS18.2.2 TaxID=2971255 RepID=UPI002150B3D4|nr:hypothetical protein [Variovorax sp. ZS18.2.2]MCR6481039.1 hypothetical protein [Variovorax sp. ZS18.2.2]